MTKTKSQRARKARLRLYNKNKGFSTNCVLLSGDWLFGTPKPCQSALSPKNQRGLASWSVKRGGYVRRLKVPVKELSGEFSFTTRW